MHTPEYAVMDGVVLEAGPASGFGLAVYIQHENGDVTVYGHMDKILVEAGQVVQAGDTIALLGNRGQSTGPHLHFEVHVGGLNGEKIDPLPWLRDRRRRHLSLRARRSTPPAGPLRQGASASAAHCPGGATGQEAERMGHGHAHAPVTAAAGQRRRLAVVLGLTLTVMVVEIVGGVLADSLALGRGRRPHGDRRASGSPWP